MHIQFSRLVHMSLCLIACLGLLSCTSVGPVYVPPQGVVPAKWINANLPRGSVADSEDIGDISTWWQRLHDPLLTEIIVAAQMASPDLRSARAKLREARARREMTVGTLYPTLSGSVSAARNRSSALTGGGGTRNYFTAGFDATWEADVFGGLRRGIEAANADLQSGEANLENTEASLAAEMARNYVELRALQIRLGIARANLASQSQTLQIAEWRAEAGLVSSQDVEQARAVQAQTQAQIPALQASLAATEYTLEFLLGKAPGTLAARLAAVAPLPAVPAQIAVGIPASALRQRPDVRAAERTLAAETARVGVAEAARYPSFNLSGSIGLDALSVGGLGNSGAVSSSLLAAIAAPILDGGRLRAQVDAQNAVREQAEIAYRQAILSALQDVENALTLLASGEQRVKALEVAVASARSASELAIQRYGAGLIDFQSVLDTQRTVLTSEDNLASARADRVLALIRLYKALGGGWKPISPPLQSRETMR